MNKEIEIRTYRAINKSKEFYGLLKAYDKDTVTITDEDGNETTFNKSDIALIRQALILIKAHDNTNRRKK